MMKFILGFTTGLIVGGVTSYLISSRRLKKIFAERLDKEINSINQTNADLAKRKANKNTIDVTEAPKSGIAIDPPKKDTRPDIEPIVQYQKSQQYNDILNHYQDSNDYPEKEEDSDDDDEEDYGGEDDDIGEFESDDYYKGFREMMQKEGRPYNITEDDFIAHNSFDKVCVTYNTAAEQFYDDQTGRVLDDGWYDCGGQSGCLDDDHVWKDGFYYVRNERISTDFRVEKSHVVH